MEMQLLDFVSSCMNLIWNIHKTFFFIFNGKKEISNAARMATKMTSVPIKRLKDISLDCSWALAKLLMIDLHSLTLQSVSCSSSLRQNLQTFLECFLAVLACQSLCALFMCFFSCCSPM